jgi:hypothetical protein
MNMLRRKPEVALKGKERVPEASTRGISSLSNSEQTNETTGESRGA